MTWDIYAVRAPGHVRRLEDLPESYPPALVGHADDVLATVRAAAPHVDASDPSWLVLNGPDHSIEVSLGKAAQVHSITFYIAGGDGAVPVVLDLARRLSITPFDTESGEVLSRTSAPPVPPPMGDDEKPGKRRWWQLGGG